MLRGESGIVSRHLNRLFQGGTISGLGEGALLERFLAKNDEAAFDAILTRYGPMVLSICRRWLDDPNDVDDAFQATFLVLVRRAGTLRRSDLLGNWLYGVAQKVARRARIDAAKRRDRDREAAKESEMNAGEADNHPDDFRPLHDEISRLPESYRAAILLCYFQGLSHEEAADRLGWPIGTVKGRLSRARDKLRDRLTRRGVTMPSATLISVLAREGRSAVPEILHTNTLRAALSVAAGRSMATVAVSAGAAALTEGVVSTMSYAKLKIAAVGLIAAATFAAGAGRSSSISSRPEDNPTKIPDKPAPETAAKEKNTATATEIVSLKQERVAVHGNLLKKAQEYYETGQINSLTLLDYSKQLMEAQLDVSKSPADRLRIIETHLSRTEEILKREEKAGDGREGMGWNLDRDKAILLDAKILLAREQDGANSGRASGDRPSTDPRLAVGKVEDPPDDEAEESKNAAIRAALEKTVPMTFRDPSPLSDVIRYVKDTTHTPEFPDGLRSTSTRRGFKTVSWRTRMANRSTRRSPCPWKEFRSNERSSSSSINSIWPTPSSTAC